MSIFTQRACLLPDLIGMGISGHGPATDDTQYDLYPTTKHTTKSRKECLKKCVFLDCELVFLSYFELCFDQIWSDQSFPSQEVY